jgi:hypothetical protein
MKLLSYIKLNWLLGLLVIAGTIVSCDKRDDANDGKTELLSFGPTGAQHGDTVRFVGRNMDKVTEIDFVGAKVMKDNFKSQNREQILVVVPDAALEGFITLKSPTGDVVSKTKFNLEVLPVITSITAESRPGDNITIKGKYLEWITGITFALDKPATTIVSKTLTELVVKVPDDAQTGTLIIFYGGTKSSFFETTTTVKVTLPAITSMSPNPILHAGNLTITGTNLDLVKKITFNNVTTPVTTFVSQSATQLVVKVPGAASKGKLKLMVASGLETVSTADLDVTLPAITGMAPNPIDPGADLTINGTNLNLVSSVSFQNAPAVASAAFVSQSASQIVVKVPNGVLNGKITLGVVNSTLTVQSPDILQINGAVPDPTISFPIYNDVLTANWNGWLGGGWGGTKDMNNTSPVRVGTKSVKIDYVGGWGSPLQLGGANISLASYTQFKVSIYGGAGTQGKQVNIGINGADAYTIVLQEGKWTDYSIPISTLTSAANLTDIIIKEFNGTGGFTIYVDALGLN